MVPSMPLAGATDACPEFFTPRKRSPVGTSGSSFGCRPKNLPFNRHGHTRRYASPSFTTRPSRKRLSRCLAMVACSPKR